MAANNGGSESTGRKNYYNISYGMLSTNAKDAPEGYEKISLSEIKSRRTKYENVDLRSKFYDTETGKDYPLRVFYTNIDGIIDGVEKDKYDKGTSLKVTLHDSDGDESIIQTDFYGKISADFLNRLLNANPANTLNFKPYSIPSNFDGQDGSTINFYSAGVSIKDNGTKVKRAFNKDNGLPPTEQVQNSKGDMETSRVNQINFLWAKVEAKYASVNAGSGIATEQPAETAPAQASQPAQPAKAVATAPATTGVPAIDLPF